MSTARKRKKNKPANMTRRRYAQLMEATSKMGFRLTAVARACSSHRDTVKKAWDRGWPALGLRPIREVIDEEQAAARAELYRRENEKIRQEPEAEQRVNVAVSRQLEQERARKDRANARVEEVAAVRITRRNAMALGTACALLTQRAIRLAEGLATDEALDKLSPQKKIQTIRAIARTVKEAAEATAKAIHMERVLLGQPTEITKVTGDGDLSPEEAVDLIKRANAAVENRADFQKWGGELRLVEGGKVEEQ